MTAEPALYKHMLCIRPMCTYLSMSLLAVLAVTAVARLCLARDLLQQSISPNVRVTVDVSRTHPMPESLYGIFFEEVSALWDRTSYDEEYRAAAAVMHAFQHQNQSCPWLQIQHAGEGGLYAELVQDRSFSGLAYTQASHLLARNTPTVLVFLNFNTAPAWHESDMACTPSLDTAGRAHGILSFELSDV